MAPAPILYVLRDLTLATKGRAWEAIWSQGGVADWSLCRSIELAASGRLDVECALWTVLQEPWVGLDLDSWRLVQKAGMETFLMRHRGAIRVALDDRESFLALAFPPLVDEAMVAGFQIHRITPAEDQIAAFTAAERSHHLGCLFPMAPGQWPPSPDSEVPGLPPDFLRVPPALQESAPANPPC